MTQVDMTDAHDERFLESMEKQIRRNSYQLAIHRSNHHLISTRAPVNDYIHTARSMQSLHEASSHCAQQHHSQSIARLSLASSPIDTLLPACPNDTDSLRRSSTQPNSLASCYGLSVVIILKSPLNPFVASIADKCSSIFINDSPGQLLVQESCAQFCIGTVQQD